ncbi:MAG: Gfo/Idh/MocA family oxidoreductase [Treponema sp.]|jgi:predicted dehydrogenase|nr:Gfo/Idh/MocA family oxidoreductase [Treponema sp.]
MQKLKVGIIGAGYIGDSHIEAIRRVGLPELTAIADVNYNLAKSKADAFGVEKCYKSLDDLVADEEINVIHNCTPTHLHLEINEKIIKAGKHVFSEKPLGRTSAESLQMVELLKKYPDTVAGVNFCYRMNALIQDTKNRIASGEIGKPYLVHGSYLQDWLLFETDYNWRIEPEYTGVSRCVGDIGSHWMDLAQVLTGSKIVEVCANTVIALPTRKKPAGVVETFAVNTDQNYTEVNVETEDYAGVLIKFDSGASGVFQCSEISAGRKCFIDIEIDGSKASFQWNQQTSDQMWKGNRNSNNEQIMRNPNLALGGAKKYSHLAAGHPEGWNDAFKNNLDAYYHFILDGKKMGKDPCDFATFEEAHYLMRLTEAVIKSGKEKRWVKLDEV